MMPLLPQLATSRTQAAFTLVEMVVVIAITAVIFGMVAIFVLRPVQGFEAQNRRADLVDLAESALRRMQRDTRRALPNSVRIVCDGTLPPCTGSETRWVLELIRTTVGGRYRQGAGQGPTGGGIATTAVQCLLDFTTADDSFAVVGSLNDTLTAGDRLVISNWDSRGASANAYAGDNITPISTTLNLTSPDPSCDGEDRINFLNGGGPAPFLFPFRSDPGQRFFIVDNRNPVTFLCDTSGGTANITRYDGYTYTLDQTAVDSAGELIAAGATPALLADNVTACRFTYAPGTPQRGGLVTLDLTVSKDGEQVRLLHQVHVDNAP
jgi:MSHA biogenesis protein MshO